MLNPFCHLLQSPACAAYAASPLNPAPILFQLSLLCKADTHGHHQLPCSGFWLGLASERPWRETGARKSMRPRYSFYDPPTPRVILGSRRLSTEATVPLSKAALSTWPSPSLVPSGVRAVTACAGHCTLPVVSVHPRPPHTDIHSPSTQPSPSYTNWCFHVLLGPSLMHLLKVLPSLGMKHENMCLDAQSCSSLPLKVQWLCFLSPSYQLCSIGPGIQQLFLMSKLADSKHSPSPLPIPASGGPRRRL